MIVSFCIGIGLVQVASSGSGAGSFFGIVFLLLIIIIVAVVFIHKYQRKWLGKKIPVQIDQFYELCRNLLSLLLEFCVNDRNQTTSHMDIEKPMQTDKNDIGRYDRLLDYILI